MLAKGTHQEDENGDKPKACPRYPCLLVSSCKPSIPKFGIRISSRLRQDKPIHSLVRVLRGFIDFSFPDRRSAGFDLVLVHQSTVEIPIENNYGVLLPCCTLSGNSLIILLSMAIWPVVWTAAAPPAVWTPGPKTSLLSHQPGVGIERLPCPGSMWVCIWMDLDPLALAG